MLYKIRKVRDC